MSRRASNNVSLFPFLAVLVCAMGALILLLLVTTRRIRSNQLAAVQVAVDDDQLDDIDEPLPVLPPLPAPEPEEEPTFVPTIVPVDGPRVVSSIPSPVSDDARIDNHLQRDREALRGYDAILTGRLQQLADNDRQLYGAYLQAKKSRDQSTASEQQLSASAASVQGSLAEAKENDKRLDSQLAALRRAVEQKLAEPVKAISKFRIVPFDGHSGTVRRPIMIECVQDRFRFIPEDIELTRTDLEDFITTFNPLLSGASALSTHWSMKKGSTNGGGDPYVLLIVRPSGALGFYAAKRMLRRLDVPIGYELLGEEQELDLPVADQEAVRLCRLAVNRTLARRDEMMKLRPLTRSLAAGLPPKMPQTTGRARLQPTGQQSADDRVRSFEKLLAGMRTKNANRPQGMREFPDFANAPTRPSQTPDQRQANVSRNRLGQPPSQGTSSNRPSSQMGTAQLRGQTVSRQSPGSQPTSNVVQNNSGVPMQPPGAARLTPSGTPDPHPAPRFTQSPSGSSLPPGIRSPQTGTTPPQRGRVTSVTDGSTKPTQQSGSNASPNRYPSLPQAGVASQPTKQSGNQPFSNQNPQPVQYRRAVDLFVDLDSVIVGTNGRIGVNQGQVSGPWLGTILTQIEAEVRSWGDAPTGTTWAPEVRFRVSPGANRTHSRLKSSLSRLGMRTTDEFTVSPKSQTGTDVFRSQTTSNRTRVGGQR
ncbi:MAG: hypothetical protein AB8G99_19275 [Planctomycetaceae bacterium]